MDFTEFIVNEYIDEKDGWENNCCAVVRTVMLILLDDLYFRSCFERKSEWMFSDLCGFFCCLWSPSLYDLVGLMELELITYSGNDQLILYSSSAPLIQLSFNDIGLESLIFDGAPELRLTPFCTILILELFPIQTPLKNFLMQMPSKLTCLHVSICDLKSDLDKFDHLVLPPCFQHIE